ncbi:exo-1-3-beta-glucanase [Pterulicium gracile]|uniref:glucan 1,3-beta-glucosidase n=1 Tax=Pterulicium gracile TaxID=1884261 RepID=A0A5C3QDC9_9AGAR|nr:exo-1-3-beta-glucanase [Pterula gracilis]
MRLQSITALVALAFSAQQAQAIEPGFPYGSRKVRGVNLGGWLVLEPWITPSLFERTGNSAIVDEYTFGQLQSRSTAQAALKAHWDTWITEADFAAIADAGLNHVRIPIGYWAFEVAAGEPYISGQLPYLQRAVEWASKYGIKVMVDLHGAPGSQNGFDNSGLRTDNPTWATNPNNIARTNAVIKRIATLFADDVTTVPAIAPLNEPAGFRGSDWLSATRQFWHDSYGNIRYPYGSSRKSNSVVVLHDAFEPLSSWTNFMPSPQWEGVAMDKHVYQVFSEGELRKSEAQHISTICELGSQLSSFHLWTIIGEWSPASTDCTQWLNGRGRGARWDGTFQNHPTLGSCQGKSGNASTFSTAYKTFLRRFWEAQIITYEKGAGWIQWTWKAERADDWSYQAGLANGWIPRNPTNLLYPNICG